MNCSYKGLRPSIFNFWRCLLCKLRYKVRYAVANTPKIIWLFPVTWLKDVQGEEEDFMIMSMI